VGTTRAERTLAAHAREIIALCRGGKSASIFMGVAACIDCSGAFSAAARAMHVATGAGALAGFSEKMS
jgi:hypothetical protein